MSTQSFQWIEERETGRWYYDWWEDGKSHRVYSDEYQDYRTTPRSSTSSAVPIQGRSSAIGSSSKRSATKHQSHGRSGHGGRTNHRTEDDHLNSQLGSLSTSYNVEETVYYQDASQYAAQESYVPTTADNSGSVTYDGQIDTGQPLTHDWQPSASDGDDLVGDMQRMTVSDVLGSSQYVATGSPPGHGSGSQLNGYDYPYSQSATCQPATEPLGSSYDYNPTQGQGYLYTSTQHAVSSGSRGDFHGYQQNSQLPQSSNHRYIAGTAGHCEKLDKSYQVRRRDYKQFFHRGRVFSTLWTDPYSGSTTNNDTFAYSSGMIYNVKYGEPVHCKIRRFVVVRPPGSQDKWCICLPITTYGRKGARKLDINLDGHGLIYSHGRPPNIDGITKQPLKVKISKNADQLSQESFINYGKVYTVECNVKVKDVGTLDDSSLKLLWRYYHAMMSDGGDLPDPMIGGEDRYTQNELMGVGTGVEGSSYSNNQAPLPYTVTTSYSETYAEATGQEYATDSYYAPAASTSPTYMTTDVPIISDHTAPDAIQTQTAGEAQCQYYQAAESTGTEHVSLEQYSTTPLQALYTTQESYLQTPTTSYSTGYDESTTTNAQYEARESHASKAYSSTGHQTQEQTYYVPQYAQEQEYGEGDIDLPSAAEVQARRDRRGSNSPATGSRRSKRGGKGKNRSWFG